MAQPCIAHHNKKFSYNAEGRRIFTREANIRNEVIFAQRIKNFENFSYDIFITNSIKKAVLDSDSLSIIYF